MKKCSKCGRWLVASTVNFHRSKKGKYGLESQCKECRNKYGKQWHEANKDKRREYYKQYREANREKELERKRQWYQDNREKQLEYNKQYRKDNKDKILEYQKQWHKDNPEYAKQYYQENRKKKLEYIKQYRQTPQGQIVQFNRNQKRRAKEQQGTGITKDQWLDMMKFFDWKCAYSGEYLGGNDNSFNRTIDHIVPLNSDGDNMIWNCVPMTRSLNSSKCAKDMLEWYKEQDFYDPKRLDKIYEWQEYAFNKWYKEEK